MAKKKATKAAKPTKKSTKVSTDKWLEQAEAGFTPKYADPEESAAIDIEIFELYEDGTPISQVAKKIGMSVTAVKSRMLKVLLKEMYKEYVVTVEDGDEEEEDGDEE